MKNDWYWFLKTRGWESFFGKELKLILKKGEIDQLLTTCLGFGINFVFYPSGQSQKKTKIFQIARFLLQKFSEKTRKFHQVSNLRQIRVKSVFANFKHNHGPNMLYKRSRSPRHIFRSSRLFLDYLDTFFRLSGRF